MPRGDGTGPMGMGPMTGRGMGYCTGYAAPGAAVGFGRGAGIGRGRGYRRMYYATGLPGWMRYGANPYEFSGYTSTEGSAVDEKEVLKKQADYLQKQLEQIHSRLGDLEKD